MTETIEVEAHVDNAPAQEQKPDEQVEPEKVEPVVENGKPTENGNCEPVAEAAPGNEEEPKATSTPVKGKKKGRAVIANMRAAFARMGLTDKMRTLGRRMRRKEKKLVETEETEKEEKKDEEKQEQVDERMNGEEVKEEETKKEEGTEAEPVKEETCEEVSSPVATSEPTTDTAVVAQ